ncbi:Hsp20/alpha crystallin family protein [Porcincola intestinalis]|jgi:HSP20 family molecular chaperone IbpA|uniref:Hsp20/alpha crystallin family protein n=1 Tax=Porcincola intestinalis TaxID=2606632 RepID=A0A6L5X0N1_9FIRM|nr:Hsp20/alpha crystallin family protein [Porcincola intestinalis]MCI6697823.1 Hsp20/alpha crystallin family protein [Lachnospiraceae bacterium]MSS13891.1 Hsp20/alpha crystallin family protein [Porcincola intestinalis]
MLMPSIFNDNLFDDWFDDDFYMPMIPDMSDVDKKLYGGRAAHEMKTDVKETEKGYEVAVDLPGFKKDDVTVELNNGYMTITAQKKVDSDKKNKEGRYIRREHYSGSMSRSFYVGDQLTENDIHARMNDGILTLQIPKKEETKRVEDKRHLVQITAA